MPKREGQGGHLGNLGAEGEKAVPVEKMVSLPREL